MNPSLIKYVEEAEDLLRNSRDPERWVDPELDRKFVDYLTPISNCLYAKAKEILDPHFFTIEFGHFLDRIVHDVYAEKVTHQFDGQPDCNFELPTSAKLDELYNYPANDESSAYKGFEVSPYPSLVTANYLAAIGAVDTGVLMIEKWIKNFKLVPLLSG
jgi:hypothetical protein